MKNKSFILIFLVLSSTLIFGQSIKVTNPGSKTIMMKGDPVKITWVKQGRQNSYVKIRLFNSIGKRIASITDKTQNDGLFNWKLNIVVPVGKYFVRVKTVDNKVTGNSGLFQCGKSSSPPPPPPPPDPPPPPPDKGDKPAQPSGTTIIPQSFPQLTQTFEPGQKKQLKDLPGSGIVLSEMMLPDLIIIEIVINSKLPVSKDIKSIEIFVIVKNIGNADVKESDWFNIDIDDKSGLAGNTRNFTNRPIKPGKIHVIKNIHVTLNWQYKDFVPVFTVTLDSDNKLKEINENNNSANFSLKLN